MSGRGSACGL
uniref:Uncharacterized protein n=1 Tax=Anguilla anguilla TaxID=7936 RepID=A0A0E9T2R3_ANGAN